MNWKTNDKHTIPCWNCNDCGDAPRSELVLMRRFARDTFYDYYVCDACKKERAALRDDRPILKLSDQQSAISDQRSAISDQQEEKQGDD